LPASSKRAYIGTGLSLEVGTGFEVSSVPLA